jgi:transposase
MADNNVNEAHKIPDSLWEKIEPLLPPAAAEHEGGRPRIDDRKVMEAILHVFRTGYKGKAIPRSLGTSGTVQKRFQEWQEDGVFQRMWVSGILTYDEMRSLVWYGKR